MDFTEKEKKFIHISRQINLKGYKKLEKILYVKSFLELFIVMAAAIFFRHSTYILYFLLFIILVNFLRGLKNNLRQKELYNFVCRLTSDFEEKQ